MKGFTLIELLVVVLIIGILSSVALPQYTKAVEKSRQSEAWTTMKSINDAVKIYQMEKGSATALPTSWDDLTISFVNASGSTVTCGTSFSSKNFTFQMRTDGVTAARIGSGQFANNYTLGLTHAGIRSCSGTKCTDVGAKSTTAACPTGMSSCKAM